MLPREASRPRAKPVIRGTPLADSLVRAALPEIERTMPEGEFRDAMLSKLRTAIDQMLGRPRDRHARNVDWASVFRKAGRAEFLAGRPTDPLQTSLRAGARAAWRQIGTEGRPAGMSPETLLAIAESIFTSVDQATSFAIQGYHEAEAEAREKAQDARELARRRLTRAILSPEPVADEWLRALSDAAGWPVPELLGDRLTDPDARITMELALRAHMLFAPPNRRRQRWSP